MLVDHHCHLDFPDFASELDQIVARAREAGVGTMVTISTRIRQFDKVLAVAERFENVYCSVGTHPHNAHEELDIPLERIMLMAEGTTAETLAAREQWLGPLALAHSLTLSKRLHIALFGDTRGT